MSPVKKYRAKKCDECGIDFTPCSSHSKYCPECSVEVRRRQTAERTRRWRATGTKTPVPVLLEIITPSKPLWRNGSKGA